MAQDRIRDFLSSLTGELWNFEKASQNFGTVKIKNQNLLLAFC
jgi:hypothetical protein